MKDFELSNSQKRMLIFELRNEGTSAYTVPFARTFGACEEDALIKALYAVISGNLNMRLKNDGGRVTFYFSDEKPFIETADIDGGALTENLEAESAYGFPDLFDRPLYRLKLFRHGANVTLSAIFHHFIFDGSCYGILNSRIDRAMVELKGGKESCFSDLSYEIYVERENEYLRSEEFKSDRQYWIDTIGSVEDPPVLPLSDDLVISRKIVDVAPETTQRINAYCAGLRVSPNVFTLSVVSLYLSRFYNCGEIIINTAFSGRAFGEDMRDSFGMFVNLLPLVLSYDADATFADRLTAVKNTVKTSIAHGKCPVNLYLDALASRGISASSLLSFSVVSNSSRAPQPSFAVNTLHGEMPLTVRSNFMKSDEDGLKTLYIDYERGVFSDGDVERMSANLLRIIDEVSLNPAVKCSEIDIVSENEKKILLNDFMGERFETDYSPSLNDLFCAQARKTPDNIAVIYKDKKYTYARLDDITDKLAKIIASHGCAGGFVGVLINRTELMPITAMAVLKSGNAYLPLDATLPPERMEFMLNDAGAKLLVMERSLNKSLNFDGVIIYVEDVDAAEAPRVTLPKPDGDSLAVILYTSGTTGVPKGIKIRHYNVAAFAKNYAKLFDLSPASVQTAYASFGFDASLMELYPALITGAAICVAPDEMRLDLPRLNEYYLKNNVTHAFMTTQVSFQFASLIDNETLRFMLSGGEKLTPFTPKFSYKFYNAYGPTETVAFVTDFYVDKFYNDVPIGKPVYNCDIYIVDGDGRLVPLGGLGELCIAGPQVSAGYLNRPDVTERVFVKNPFRNDKYYDVMYKTGDVCKWLPDGNIAFCSRKDGQVKIRGYRIELKEVEEVIRRFDGVKDVTTAVFDNPDGSKYIAAYVVSDSVVDTDALNEFILSEKPSYMVPRITMQLDKIPLNQNYKVDKKSLPAPILSKREKSAAKAETDLQRRVTAILAEITGNSDLGVNTDIFEAGLTSIGLLRLNSAFSDAFKVSIGVKDFQKYNTVVKLEKYIEGFKEETFETLATGYPLTENQKGLLADQLAAPASTLYNIPVLLPLDRATDVNRLAEAVCCAINLHPYIKCAMTADDKGEVVQIGRDGDAAEVSVREMSGEEFAALTPRLIKPFDIFGGVLYRAEIIKTEKHVYLFCDFHHLIADGYSLGIFFEDVDAFYTNGRKPAPEAVSAFGLAQERRLRRESMEYSRARDYYAALLGGKRFTSDLPFDRPAKAGNSPSAAGFETDLGISSEAVNAYCDKHKITENVYFLGLFGQALAKAKNESCTVFCTVYNGRSNSKYSRTFGMLVNTLPVYCDFSVNQGLEEYLSAMKKQIMLSMDNDVFPFSEMSREHRVKPDIFAVYQGETFQKVAFNGAEVLPEQITTGAPKAPLTVNIYRRDGRYILNVEYRADLYTEEKMTSLATAFKALVCAGTGTAGADKEVSRENGSIKEEAGNAKKETTGKSGSVEKDVKIETKEVSRVENDVKTETKEIKGEENADVERTLCECFAEALSLPGIKPGDDFFEMGGTSITAIRLSMLLFKKGVKIVYADLFGHPTPSALAVLCREREAAEKTASPSKDIAEASIDIRRRDSSDAHNGEGQTKNNAESDFGDVLGGNISANLPFVGAKPLNNIVLTGATGFLGIHILHDFICRFTGRVYCLVRKGKSTTAETRLRTMLMFYFGNAYAGLFGERIFVVEGDVTDPAEVMQLKRYRFDAVINCAACVKHFSAGTVLEDVNVRGVENLVTLCKATGSGLIQISTGSVAGESVDGRPAPDTVLFENLYNIGQTTENAYVDTKFRAEAITLAAVREGVRGKIMRVGNLMPRASDGEFQINFLTNGFMRRLKAYALIGKLAFADSTRAVEFSPIDSTARAILTLAETPDGFTLFHAYNNHRIYMADVVFAMNKIGRRIDLVNESEFIAAVNAYVEKNKRSEDVGALFAYDNAGGKTRVMLACDNDFTTKSLYSLGYKWPIISEEYLENALVKLDGLGFFDENI